MKITADQNIPLLNEFFNDIGNITALPGRDIQAKDIVDTDILLVRSITDVNEDLLKNSSVKFVGSCTIGFDHLDVNYLHQHNITWSNAPGCNANAVVQYVLSVLATLRENWQQQRIGIVGCGNIGSRIYRCLKKLGLDVVVYDPYLTDEQCQDLVSLDEVLQRDVITCHTPLTFDTEFPSFHLIDKDELNKISDDALLINAGRGGVINNKALLEVLQERPLSVALDVWENEPDIDRELLKKITLATPHIAGYSLEGKEQGTYMIYKSLCEYMGISVDDKKKVHLSSGQQRLNPYLFEKNKNDKEVFSDDADLFNRILLACYAVKDDDRLLRENNDFDALRKNYHIRREYSYYQLPETIVDKKIRDLFSVVQGEF